MAHVPTNGEVEKLQASAEAKIQKKVEYQQAQGKDFVVDDEGHHSGVIPEAVWKGLPGKSIDDTEATE